MPRSILVAMLFLAAGCADDPCEGVDCSGFGDCVVDDGVAGCDCDDGYLEEGLGCVADPCWEIDCSGFGDCVVVEEAASCDCDDGYQAEGLECVLDVCWEVDCSGHGECADHHGSRWCVCEPEWAGEDCERCAPSHELDQGDCVPVAEYVVKDLGDDGRYAYDLESPWPSHVRDATWEAGGARFPFRAVDAAMRLEGDTPWEVFTSGDQYILYQGGSWVSCADADCLTTSPGPGTLCDAWWDKASPFCDRIDSMTQLGEGEEALILITRGTGYVLWSADLGYHQGDGSAGPGTIGDAWWDGAGEFPFTTIDAMVDYTLPEERVLILSGRQAVTCPLEGLCSDPFEVGSADDPFFPFQWQALPFASEQERAVPVDALIRSGDGHQLFIVSNTPLTRTPTPSRLHLLDSEEGPRQRALVLTGTAYDQGWAQGYLLGEEIMAVLTEIMVPFYNEHIPETVALAGGASGYQAARQLGDLFTLDGEYSVYADEQQGLVDGILANPLTTGLVFDAEAGEAGVPLALEDIMALQAIDDLWGTGCKSAAVWPATAPTVDGVIHLSIIDWLAELGRYNLIVAYDHAADPERMDWIGASWSGNLGGFTFGMNEAGAVTSYVSSGGELRSCPAGRTQCMDARLAQVDGLTLHSTAWVSRRAIERLTTVDQVHALLQGVQTMTVTGFTVTSAEGSAGTPGAVFEMVYPGIESIWPATTGYTFVDTDGDPDLEVRVAADDPFVGELPVLVSTANMVKIYGPLEYGPVYGPFRDELVAAYPDGIDADSLAATVADDDHDPLFYYPDSTIQLTIGEPAEPVGDSAIVAWFGTGEDAPNVFADGASHGRHSWDEVFGRD